MGREGRNLLSELSVFCCLSSSPRFCSLEGFVCTSVDALDCVLDLNIFGACCRESLVISHA